MFTEQELREIFGVLAEKSYELQCRIDDGKDNPFVVVLEKELEEVERLMKKCTKLIFNL
jgi:hypothetical protein